MPIKITTYQTTKMISDLRLVQSRERPEMFVQRLARVAIHDTVKLLLDSGAVEIITTSGGGNPDWSNTILIRICVADVHPEEADGHEADPSPYEDTKRVMEGVWKFASSIASKNFPRVCPRCSELLGTPFRNSEAREIYDIEQLLVNALEHQRQAEPLKAVKAIDQP